MTPMTPMTPTPHISPRELSQTEPKTSPNTEYLGWAIPLAIAGVLVIGVSPLRPH